MSLPFKVEDFNRMLAIETQLREVLRRAQNEQADLSLAVFALARLQREFLNLMPGNVRGMLVRDCLIPFLNNEPIDRKAFPQIVTVN